MTHLIETERLRLREFTLDDTAFVITLVNSPGWLQFIGDRNIRTTEQAKAYLENGPLKSYQLHGYGLSLIELKNNGMAIGMCGILNRDTLDMPDIGFALLPEYGGKGYAFEIVRATLDYSRTKLNLATIAAIVMPSNVQSIKLLEKTGFIFSKSMTLPGANTELLLYTNEER